MKKVVKLTESDLVKLVKNVLIEQKKQIKEVERYVPGIDSPEDEDELGKEYGLDKKYDVYKEKNPFKSVEDDDFYYEKLKDIKLKGRPKMMDLGYKSKETELAPTSLSDKGMSQIEKDYLHSSMHYKIRGVEMEIRKLRKRLNQLTDPSYTYPDDPEVKEYAEKIKDRITKLEIRKQNYEIKNDKI